MNASMPPPLPVIAARRFVSAFKPLFIGVLALLLLIPLMMVRSLLSERQHRRAEAISNITETWGQSQTLIGPVLVVPYQIPVKTRREQRVDNQIESVDVTSWSTAYGCFLPTNLQVVGSLDPSVLHRGIYEAAVYRGDFSLKGAFAPPDFSEWKIEPENILWDEAVVLISVSDPRGLSDSLVLQFGDAPLTLEPGSNLASFDRPLRTRIPDGVLKPDEAMPFTLDLKLNGSRSLLIAPVGMQTHVALDSTWADPSFQGAFLPVEREVAPAGFKANWQVSYYGRPVPQSWTSADGSSAVAGLKNCAFGVSLVTPVDNYRLVERSLKYGILFIVLIFTAFFLFETLARLRIHPLQYLLVGAALCIFYLILLALSEIQAFWSAYLVAAVASTALVTGYSAAILGRRRRAGVIGLELVLIYGFLYTTLQLQDYALVLGSVGLFAALAVVMYSTRRVNWYSGQKTEG
ncbi:MAG: cell envelope integrity protein CreD [Kiritimatiellia bacterium]|jgi:inner membrane protein